jgi:hypothetical protein
LRIDEDLHLRPLAAMIAAVTQRHGWLVADDMMPSLFSRS